MERNWERELPYTRNCECLDCGHKWMAKVILSDVTTNLSGEKTEECPKCWSRNVMRGPAIK